MDVSGFLIDLLLCACLQLRGVSSTLTRYIISKKKYTLPLTMYVMKSHLKLCQYATICKTVIFYQ